MSMTVFSDTESKDKPKVVRSIGPQAFHHYRTGEHCLQGFPFCLLTQTLKVEPYHDSFLARFLIQRALKVSCKNLSNIKIAVF